MKRKSECCSEVRQHGSTKLVGVSHSRSDPLFSISADLGRHSRSTGRCRRVGSESVDSPAAEATTWPANGAAVVTVDDDVTCLVGTQPGER